MNDAAKTLRDRSFAFALRIVKLIDVLDSERRDWTLSRQLLKSGTSIGANIREARFAQSTADFVSKLSIALKEAEETSYWLELLHGAQRISTADFQFLSADLNFLIGTLVNTIKTCKSHIAQELNSSARRAT